MRGRKVFRKSILAESEDACLAALAKTIDNMERVGLGDLETKMTERYVKYYNALHEDRNARWDVVLDK